MVTRIAKSTAKGWLANVPEDKVFWCSDGRVLKNLAALEIALREMNDDTFRYHANDSKNDFSKWVKDVIGDEKLSRDLQKSANRAQAAKNVASRIAFLKEKV
ncbi:MAG: hypothetical protein HY665_10040, partial [Chloroflexi bacterium]|nr:hypothetical protein [Chloroflexota bacterium]